MRILGLDPGLNHTGWGLIEKSGSRLSFIAAGTVSPKAKAPLSDRLAALHKAVFAVTEEYAPDEAAIEETFVNQNPRSTLKLGQARGVIMLAPALLGLPVAEYAPNLIKKAVVGTGHAAKEQIAMMVKTLLPTAQIDSADAADALAVAICHANMRTPYLGKEKR